MTKSGLRCKWPKVTNFDDFLEIFERVLGVQIRPKSTKMASETRLIFHPFSDLRCDRFSTSFCSKMESKNDDCSPRNRKAQLCKIIYVQVVSVRFRRFGASNPSKNGCRTKLVFACVADPVSGRFSEAFGVPKRSQKWSGTGLFGISKKHGFAKLCKLPGNRRSATDLGGLGLRIWLCI